MKSRVTVLVFSLLLYCLHTQAQQLSLQSKAILVKRMVELNHFSPKPVDDSFSVAMFRSLLTAADNRKLLFTDAEYKLLLAYSTTLDEELKGKGWNFFNLFESTYKRSLLRADSIVTKLLQKPFDFSANESITFSKEQTFNFAADPTALSARWSKYLKYKALDQLFDIVSDDSTGKTTMKSAIASSEAKVRERIRIAESKRLKKILEHPAGFSKYVSDLYLNSIAAGFDPHSNYFSQQDKEEFKSALSTETLSFGLELDENEDGQIIISQLTPGGPAWKSGDINEGDELLSLQWEGKEAVEIAGLDVEDVYAILNQSMNDRLVVKSRKQDGTVKFVFLTKEKIENEENVVKGFVLKGEKKIGYIVLPAFYTQWENETGSSCANDVAKEIVKLKRENIDALILDVRYNGGGSLAEAMEMAGIFIDEGPLMGQKQKTGKTVFLKDPNRGTIYNGPMALMVNGQSASASEILAGTLQDYNRAVIIGSNTFGKATMQQMMALDTITSKPGMIGNAKDVVKITTGKLYRLNGETAQLNGVKPDVVLPDAFDGIDYREKFFPAALSQDVITKNNYYKPLAALPVSELSKRSEERVKDDKNFAAIKTLITAIRSRIEKREPIPLKPEGFEQWAKQQEPFTGFLKTRSASLVNKKFTAENHSLDKAILANSSYTGDINKEWLQGITEDIYIQEAYSVLCDLVNLQQTKN
jgi:carboxyl-terminal processing protease